MINSIEKNVFSHDEKTVNEDVPLTQPRFGLARIELVDYPMYFVFWTGSGAEAIKKINYLLTSHSLSFEVNKIIDQGVVLLDENGNIITLETLKPYNIPERSLYNAIQDGDEEEANAMLSTNSFRII